MKKLSIKANLIWNSFGSFTYLFCQWLLTLLVVRLSSNLSDAGNFSLAISITNIFYNLACFNIRPYLVSDSNNEYQVEDYTTFRLVTCILATILCIIYILLFQYTINQLICIILYMIFKIGEAFVDLFHAFEQRKSRMDIGGFSLFSRGIISLVSFYLSFIISHNLNISIIFMIITTWIFIILFDYKKVKQFEKIKIYFNKDKIINLFLKFLPLAIGTFIGTMSTSLPRQFLESIKGTDILGIYATVATPAVIVQTAASYIYNPLLVTFSDYKNKKDLKHFSNLFFKTTLIIFILSIICLIGSFILSKWGLNLLYGSKISKYYYLFSWIIVYTSLNGYLWFCYNILIIFRRMKTLLYINISGFIICLLTTKPIINYYGMNGVSYSLILFTIVIIIEMLIIIFKDIKKLK